MPVAAEVREAQPGSTRSALPVATPSARQSPEWCPMRGRTPGCARPQGCAPPRTRQRCLSTEPQRRQPVRTSSARRRRTSLPIRRTPRQQQPSAMLAATERKAPIGPTCRHHGRASAPTGARRRKRPDASLRSGESASSAVRSASSAREAASAPVESELYQRLHVITGASAAMMIHPRKPLFSAGMCSILRESGRACTCWMCARAASKEW